MKKYDYDYKDFDRITIAIKNKNDNLLEVYKKFGWNVLSTFDDKQYGDIKYYVLERKHLIENKDDLNFLQVSYELNINKISKLDHLKCAKTTSVGLSLGLISISLLVLSIILLIKYFNYTNLIISSILLVIGLLIGVFNFILSSYLLKKDKLLINEKINIIKLENENILAKVGELYYE